MSSTSRPYNINALISKGDKMNLFKRIFIRIYKRIFCVLMHIYYLQWNFLQKINKTILLFQKLMCKYFRFPFRKLIFKVGMYIEFPTFGKQNLY